MNDVEFTDCERLALHTSQRVLLKFPISHLLPSFSAWLPATVLLSLFTLHACSQVETMAALSFAMRNSLAQTQLPPAQPPAGLGSVKSPLPK